MSDEPRPVSEPDSEPDSGPAPPVLSTEARTQLLARCRGRLQLAQRSCLENTAIDSGFAVIRELAHQMDALLADLHQTHAAAAVDFDERRSALVALGGYGREALHLYSDVDLLFLTPDRLTSSEEAVVKSMFQLLWDIGIDLGHATRDLDQCLQLAGTDLESVTALIDSRCLAGNHALHEELMQRFNHRLRHDQRDWFLAVKRHKWDQRHARYGSTVYNVEPNVKESEGGLRDYHALRWLLFVVTGQATIDHLIAMELFTLDEYNELLRSVDFLHTVRNLLHQVEGRRSDILSFERQSQLAKLLGYASDKRRLAEERFMRDFYHHARIIQTLTGRAVEELNQRKSGGKDHAYQPFKRRKLRSAFFVERGRLDYAENLEEHLLPAPHRLMHLFELAAEERVTVSHHLKASIRKLIDRIDADAFQRSPQCRVSFLKILAAKGWVCPLVREMHDCGVLNLYLPEFENLYCLVQADRYHQYTVDEHSIRTLQHSDAFGACSPSLGGPLWGELCAAARCIERWDLLNFALLIHDIGKGEGHGHVLRGGQLAQRIGDRIGLDEQDAQLVRFLSLNHLRLIHTALRRDLNDPEVIGRFADEVGDPQRVHMLFLLTVCDLMAVGQGAWTEWKGSLLNQLYQRTAVYLEGGELEDLDATAHPDLARRIAEHLAPEEAAPEELERFVHNLPPRYTSSFRPQRMAEHFQLLRGVNEQEPLVWRLRRPRQAMHSELTVCTTDHPGVFGLICGALAAKRINILSAQIHTTRDGYVIDCFQLTNHLGQPIPRDFNLERMRQLLGAIIRGEKSEADLLKAIPPLAPPAPEQVARKAPIVIVDNHSSRTCTIIEVKCFDQPGLLFHLMRAFQQLGLDLDLAFITTEAYRAVDVFYVTDLEHQKIEKEADLQRLRESLELELNHPIELTIAPSPVQV